MIIVILSDHLPSDSEHTGWFDAMSEVSENFAKLGRYTFAFDPKDIHYV